jgi:hypothetical protein
VSPGFGDRRACSTGRRTVRCFHANAAAKQADSADKKRERAAPVGGDTATEPLHDWRGPRPTPTLPPC